MAFPGKVFNKYHGLFCTIQVFMHNHHIAGQVSEKSYEAYTGTLAETKRVLEEFW